MKSSEPMALVTLQTDHELGLCYGCDRRAADAIRAALFPKRWQVLQRWYASWKILRWFALSYAAGDPVDEFTATHKRSGLNVHFVRVGPSEEIVPELPIKGVDSDLSLN